MRVPRINIDHATGEFVDDLSGERTTTLTVVLLGLIKQRVLWPAVMGEDKSPPLCRSYDYKVGRPGEEFPWEASGFDQGAAPADENGLVVPCSSCALKEWGSHPKRDKVPWCQEQFIFSLVRPVGEGGFAPAILTFQRSAMKACKGYVSVFQAAGQPLFTVVTTITLQQESRGTVKYATPSFSKGRETKQDNWPSFAEQSRGIRSFLQSVPEKREDDGGPTPAPVPAAPRPAAPATAAPIPEREPVPVAVVAPTAAPEDDDLPF